MAEPSEDGLGRPHFVSPFVGFVHSTRQGQPRRYGIYHRLTGISFDTTQAVQALLKRTQAAGAPVSMGALGAADGRLPGVLAVHGFVTRSTEPEALLAPFWEWHLTLPVHNPSVISLAGAHGPASYALPDLSICLLPRVGDRPPVLRTALDATGATLLAAADEMQILASAGGGALSLTTLMQSLEALSHRDRQLVRLIPDRASALNPMAPHQFPMQNFVSTTPQTSASDHYEHAIADPAWNFDWLEPTVAHALRRANAAFNGSSYGARFALRALAEVTGDGPIEVLEIGGGTGDFAREFLVEARRPASVEREIRYTLVDRSPALSAVQAESLRRAGLAARFVVGDAGASLPEGPQFQLAIANEVIADLDVAELDGGCSVTQVGADRLVATLSRRLAPGGVAILTEYGSRQGPPERVNHLGHVEYSVDFSQIEASAERHGLRATVMPLTEFLEARLESLFLVGQQEHLLCLAGLLAEEGRCLEFRAYDQREFDELFGDIVERRQVVGLSMSPLAGGQQYGPDLKQFWAALLRKPTG